MVHHGTRFWEVASPCADHLVHETHGIHKHQEAPWNDRNAAALRTWLWKVPPWWEKIDPWQTRLRKHIENCDICDMNLRSFSSPSQALQSCHTLCLKCGCKSRLAQHNSEVIAGLFFDILPPREHLRQTSSGCWCERARIIQNAKMITQEKYRKNICGVM